MRTDRRSGVPGGSAGRGGGVCLDPSQSRHLPPYCADTPWADTPLFYTTPLWTEKQTDVKT